MPTWLWLLQKMLEKDLVTEPALLEPSFLSQGKKWFFSLVFLATFFCCLNKRRSLPTRLSLDSKPPRTNVRLRTWSRPYHSYNGLKKLQKFQQYVRTYICYSINIPPGQANPIHINVPIFNVLLSHALLVSELAKLEF